MMAKQEDPYLEKWTADLFENHVFEKFIFYLI